MSARFEDRAVIVTGGSSGIGLATARRFAEEGARVAIVARGAERVAEAAAAIPGALGIACDVALDSRVRAMVTKVEERFGRIDVLVNNAGYGIVGTVVDTSEEDWDRLIAANLKGVFLCSKHVIPVMRRQGRGAIVNVGSICAHIGIRKRAAYGASKGGVVALTKAMALDHLPEGIRVNSIAPGTIATEYQVKMIERAADPVAYRRHLETRQPIGRMAEPVEVANAILYLASDEAAYAVGTDLVLDGGWLAG